MKNYFRILPLTFLATAASVFAATTPATNASPAAPAPAPTKAAAPAKPASILDVYIDELAAGIKLTDQEKKEIAGYYTADGDLLKKILNDDSLSPAQKAAQVSGLRDTRNAKIEKLLQDVDRQHAFPAIEARYRVALTEFAAGGGLVAQEPPPAAPAPAPAPAPAQAEKTPTDQGAAK